MNLTVEDCHRIWSERFSKAIELARSLGQDNLAQAMETIAVEAGLKLVVIRSPTEITSGQMNAVLSLIEKHEFVNMTVIIKKLCISRTYALEILHRLMSQGKVSKHGHGPATHYELVRFRQVV